VQAALAKLGVQTMIYYPKTVADHVITKAFDKGPYPQSEKACKEVLALPIYPELTKNEIEAVVKGLETVLG
jgi:dTDP-4-amino-4,6-dideoxygalactose transaminase